MKTISNKMLLKKQVISALNAIEIKGGLQKATQSDQALTGCHTNCTAGTSQKQ